MKTLLTRERESNDMKECVSINIFIDSCVLICVQSLNTDTLNSNFNRGLNIICKLTLKYMVVQGSNQKESKDHC